jgi:RimJ/RimL family protein N-acetyltransferase
MKLVAEFRQQHPPIAAPLGEVETDRLRLRRFRADDLDALAVVFAKPDVWWYPYRRAFARDETRRFLADQMGEWDECGFGCWLAVEKATAQVVGYVGLSVPTFLPEILPAVEVGWRFDPAVWGRGYATEGATAALDEGFSTLGLDRICSVPQSDNPASVRVAERLGMRRAGTVAIPPTDRRGAVEGALYEITRDAWLADARSRRGRGA